MADKKNIKAIYDMCARIVLNEEKKSQADKSYQPDSATLSTLRESFLDIIDFEKMHLINAHDQFYGCMLMSMETEINFNQKGPIDIVCATEPFLVTFNPMYCCKYKFSEFTALLVSEILRLAFAHPATYSEYNREKDDSKHNHLERASAASVNEMVTRDIRLDKNTNARLRLPQDAYTMTNIHSDCGVRPKENESIDYYYKVLEKFDKKKNDDGPSNGNGSGSDSNESGVSIPGNSMGKSIHNWEENDSEEQKERIISLVSEVFNGMDDKQRGCMPGALVEQIKALLAPPAINWKQILRKMVGSVPVPHRKTRRRLNRRQPERGDLSGKLPKRIVEIIVAIDTSGSMGAREISYCLNEIFNMVKDYEGSKVTIVECDMEIGKIYEAKKLTDVQTKMSGRGGTAFTPVIEYINGEPEYKKYKNAGRFRNALMVYFTDGYGEYEIPKPMTYRNLWVVMEDEKNLSLKEPYGDVKSLKTDKDYMRLITEN